MNKLLTNLKEGIGLLPVLKDRPGLILSWIKSSVLALAVLAVLVILVPTVFSTAVDKVLEATYRPVKEKSLFGLREKVSENPRLKSAKVAGRVFLWTSSGLVVFAMMLLTLPQTVRREPVVSTEKKAPSIDAGEQTLVEQPKGEATIKKEAERYAVREVLGRGAMGVVYKGYDNVLERDVAIKEIHEQHASSEDTVGRFRHEAKILAKLTHQNIVQVYDFREVEGVIWIVLEYIEGRELGRLLKDKRPMEIKEAAGLGAKMADAMAYAHDRGVIHRDFKPSNVLLTIDGTPKITDFGIAKLVGGEQQTQTGTIMGSPAYISPEQARGRKADHRTDIYSMGVVLYQMITGNLPFVAEDVVGYIGMHLNDAPVPPVEKVNGVPGPLNDLIISMLEKDPDKRVGNMKEVANTLRQFA